MDPRKFLPEASRVHVLREATFLRVGGLVIRVRVPICGASPAYARTPASEDAPICPDCRKWPIKPRRKS